MNSIVKLIGRHGLAGLITLVALAGSSFAAEPQADPAMTRMRDAMKKLSQRIVDAESQMVTAQAAQFAAEAQVKELTAKLEAANKQLKQVTVQASADKANAETKIEDLEKKVESRDKTIVQYNDALGKWKAGFEQAQKVANAKEGERVQAAGKVIEMERKVASHEQKNREMYRLALEILDRYQSFGLGTALMAREPFVGSMRVKFENFVQDYGDKLATQKIAAEQPAGAINKAQ